VKPHNSRKQVREEPLGIAQKRALALGAPQLLEERERDDLRVREALYGFVASSAVGVEIGVGVVDEAEEDGQGLFPVWARRGVWLGWAICCSLVRGD
jgi:hypothetical protein